MPVTTIPPGEVHRLAASGQKPNIIDVRTPAEFSAIHVRARLVPLDSLDPAAIASQDRQEGEPVYVICQAGGRAAKAAERLSEAGVHPVYSIEGGTDAWAKQGLPVERGQRKTISLERQVRIAAGSLVCIGALLAWRVHPAFLGVCGFVGAGLVFAGITDYCGMGMLTAKMPWNR